MRYARWQVAAILIGTLIAFLLVVPSLLPGSVQEAASRALPAWAFRPIVLGLDLQGGAHMLLEVDTGDLIHKGVDTLRDDVRRVLRENKISISGGIGALERGVQVRIADEAERQKALTPLRALAQPVGNVLSGTRTLEVTETPDGLIQLTMTDAGINDRIRRAVDQSIEVIRRRVDALGTREPNIQREGNDRIVVEVPGLQDTGTLKEILGTTAKLEFRLVANPGEPPSEVETLPDMEGDKQIGTIAVQRRVMVEGEDLTDAQQAFDSRTGEPIVNFRFNIRGGQRFGDVTRDNVGKRFAIVLDNKVISAPVIQTPILGGSGQISGRFTVEKANNLAVLLRAGALPAKLTIAEERTVGPGLGQDSIDAGKHAVVLAAILVSVFMIATYGLFGIFANIALFVHVILIFAIMAILGATLTLPGIAGIVLTIGTAVDSNVLIYERIREESKAGRSMISAIDAGFKRAFATIFDSNSTMAIAALILFLMGSGPVKGFAVVFLFGIFTTVITAVTMTRMMIARWYQVRRPRTMPF
ncbi:MAG: protein translocase subunit SecD [Methylobacteriaceae bacterium]|nr:protein translocase subunit SecD [Methylobacteriaceae bacterium]MBV9633538.1 protein translocase subunit SecD [Methylobacteriaceae bacterium]MBV9702885.1 protein translocase subunit SecD [Methylobacteriaceae bacterium]